MQLAVKNIQASLILFRSLNRIFVPKTNAKMILDESTTLTTRYRLARC